MRTWWRYGRTRWTRRDYLRHFGWVTAATFLVTFPYVAVMATFT